MDGIGDKAWKIKGDNVAQRFVKLQEALGRMDEFDSQMESKIIELKALARGIETLM
jgi:hypothetical protein